ncbi:MAG: IPT/TIG domain-containing protein [Myxococcales bacterium]|nr:IPT/TIG domain-containing protein [Myxococcales bacterium]
MYRILLGGLLVGLLGSAFACEGGGEMAILDVDPKVGHTQGDQYVKILGQNFRQDIGYTVYFGTKKSKQVTILDPETILVSTPTGMDVGAVDIMIRADDGNAWRIAEGFKFEDMGGSVVEGIGAGATGKDKGNLKY